MISLIIAFYGLITPPPLPLLLFSKAADTGAVDPDPVPTVKVDSIKPNNIYFRFSSSQKVILTLFGQKLGE